MGTTDGSMSGFDENVAQALGVSASAIREDRRRVLRRVAESAGISPGEARRRYGPAYDDRLERIAGLVREGWPREVGAMLPLYWTAKRAEGWFVLGGSYGDRINPDEMYACNSLAEARSEVGLCRMLDLAAVRRLGPAQFADEVRAELREAGGWGGSTKPCPRLASGRSAQDILEHRRAAEMADEFVFGRGDAGASEPGDGD